MAAEPAEAVACPAALSLDDALLLEFAATAADVVEFGRELHPRILELAAALRDPGDTHGAGQAAELLESVSRLAASLDLLGTVMNQLGYHPSEGLQRRLGALNPAVQRCILAHGEHARSALTAGLREALAPRLEDATDALAQVLEAVLLDQPDAARGFEPKMH